VAIFAGLMRPLFLQKSKHYFDISFCNNLTELSVLLIVIDWHLVG